MGDDSAHASGGSTDGPPSGAGPLAGVRVVDMSRALAGPYAGLMLADAGADVIKVERPGSGDDSRGWGPPFVGEQEISTYYLSINRSKRSIELDFKDEADVEVLRRLLDEADVLVENFRPGVMDRLGIDPATLMERNPRLVVLSITGFGEGGPDGHRSGFDQIIQGEAGLMSLTGQPGGPPTRFGIPITDILSGMFGAYGVVAALHERDRTGRGQRVTTSLLAAAVAVHAYQGTRWTVGGEVAGLGGNHHPSIAPYGAFRCGDGFINISVGSEGLWARFAPVVGLEIDDPRYATNGDRVQAGDELVERIEEVLGRQPVDHWMGVLDDAGVPAGRIRSMDDVYGWDQLAHLGLVDHVEHPDLGEIALPGPPLRWSESGRATPTPPPRLGEHTNEVLDDLD